MTKFLTFLLLIQAGCFNLLAANSSASDLPIAGILTGTTLEEALQTEAFHNNNDLFATTNHKMIQGNAQQVTKQLNALPLPKSINQFFVYSVSPINPNVAIYGIPVESLSLYFMRNVKTKKFIVIKVSAIVDLHRTNPEGRQLIKDAITDELGKTTDQSTDQSTWKDKNGTLTFTFTKGELSFNNSEVIVQLTDQLKLK